MSSVTSYSPQALVLENAFPAGNGSSYDLILEFTDENGNVLDASVYQPSEALLKQEIVPLVTACFASYAKTLPKEQGESEELFMATTLVKQGDDCRIQGGDKRVDGKSVALSTEWTKYIAKRHPEWRGTTVKDGMDLLLSLFRGRSVEWMNNSPQEGDRMPLPNPPVPHPISSQREGEPAATGARVSVANNPPPIALAGPAPSQVVHALFPGVASTTESNLSAEQLKAREGCEVFPARRFQLTSIPRPLTIQDILNPKPGEKDKIKAIFEDSIGKIRRNEELTADQKALWGMLQGYFFQRQQNLTYPWAHQMKADAAKLHQLFRSSPGFYHNYIGTCFQYHLGMEFLDLLEKYQIPRDVDPIPGRLDPVLLKLWSADIYRAF